MIRFEQVSYTYPAADRRALHRFDLSVAGGERVLLAGVSGSGKSTVLRTVNGLVPHFYGGRFGGRAVIGGADTRTTSPQALAGDVGTVFQDLPARFLTGSIEDEIGFSLELAGMDPAAISGVAHQLGERMGLADLNGRRLEHLSAGEQARLSIAAAAARGPRVLVLDEPLTHLDPIGAMAAAEWVRDLSQQDGTTVLIAEHRLEAWAEVVERVVPVVPPDGPPAADGAMEVPEAAPPVRPVRLEAIGLALGFGAAPVLREIDLVLAPGELVALVGRNGSGKTTLLRGLIGLQRPASGEVRLDGSSTAGQSVHDIARVVGYVPQAPSSLLFADSVEAELDLTLRARPRTAPAEPARAWLRAFGLDGLAGRYPRDLSAGERQRVALAAVLAARPSIVLLDEPTLGMDRRRMDWLGWMLGQLRRAGAAILVATHDPAFVATHATRAVLLGSGRVQADGVPEDVLAADEGFAAALARWRRWRTRIPDAEDAGPGSRPATGAAVAHA